VADYINYNLISPCPQHFRRRDPVDADETEFMENLFDSLCSALSEPEIKSLFLTSEGVDLMLLMMKWAVFLSPEPVFSPGS